MSWQTFHRRGEVLRAVTTVADTRRDGLLPMDVAGVADTFDDELDLLAALTLKWHTRLAGRIEQALAEEPVDLADAVAAAWSQTARDLPGVRRVIDRHRAEPLDDTMARALAIATAKERRLLAAAAGRADGDGGAVERQARALLEGPRLEVVAPRGGLVARLRAALAA